VESRSSRSVPHKPSPADGEPATNKLKFRRAGLDQLRLSRQVRDSVRELVAEGQLDSPQERVSHALVYLALVACSNESACVHVNDRDLAVFVRDHSETLLQLLAEVIGEKTFNELEAEITKSESGR
jgi:hypothetical protein